MKKILFAFIAFMSLGIGYAQFGDEFKQGNIPQFLGEMQVRDRVTDKAALSSPLMRSQFVLPSKVEGVMMVDAFIGIDNNAVIDVLQSMGVEVNCAFDGFVTARIPLNVLTSVSQLGGVNDVQISGYMDLCTDSTLRVTHAGQLLDGIANGLPQAYDGSGVIIGVIDGGFDYQHETFKSAGDQSHSRIVRVYDPMNTKGSPAVVEGRTLPGSVFMGEQIDTMTYDANGTHGTHVASIAAGTHVNGYGGMAPGADIVLCSSRTLNSGVSETEVVNCIKYIFAYADSVNKPCVINVSMSTNLGSHDGKDYISRAVKSLVGPGRIFVMAAGNNGAMPYYVHGPSTSDKPLNILVDYFYSQTDNNYYYLNESFNVWTRGTGNRMKVKFHVFDKRTNRIVWESEPVGMSGIFTADDFGEFYGPDPALSNMSMIQAHLMQDANSSRYYMNVSLFNMRSKSYTFDPYGRYVSNYRLGLSVYPENEGAENYVDAWMGSSNGRFGRMIGPVYSDSITEDSSVVTIVHNNFYAVPDNNCSINSYAVCDSVISAGAYVARNTFYSLNRDSVVIDPTGTVGAIYGASSYEMAGFGPTGVALPTITAPGFDVIAAGSRYSYFQTNLIHRDLVMRSDNGSLWGVMTGTSMAAPTVAGIIAQWLQIQPDLSVQQVKDLIARTAIKDNYTYTSPRFGPNGKINALGGAVYLINNNPNFMLGDVNGDGKFSIKDLSVLIDYLLGENLLVFVSPAADVNLDGFISIKDIGAMIDLILGPSGDEPA